MQFNRTSQTSQILGKFWSRFWLVKRDEIGHLKLARRDETSFFQASEWRDETRRAMGLSSNWRDEPRRARLVSPARAKKTRRALARSTSNRHD